MIREITMYTLDCDNCKCNAFEGDEIIAWTDDSSPLELIPDEWIEIGDKVYCSDCVIVDDNDNLIVDGKIVGNNE